MSLTFQAYTYHVEQLIQAALAAAEPATAVRQHLHRAGRLLTIDDYTYNLDEGQIFLVSVGKAAVPMGIAAAKILGDTVASGIVVTKKTGRNWGLSDVPSAIGDTTFSLQPSALSLFEGNHPVSGEDSLRATRAVIDMLGRTRAHDLVLCLISGGSSALFTQPLVPLDDWQQLNRALLSSGCSIDEFNTVRRQLDHVKGGGLARLAAPAACVSLILSDVVGNPLAIIGSGPTAPADDTPADARAILERYNIESAVTADVWQRIKEALEANNSQASDVETHNFIVSDVRQAALAAVSKAGEMGFAAQLLTAQLEGEAREVGRVAAAIARDTPPGRCLVMGGETTVTLRGEGSGGRNQEAALAAAIALDGWPNVAIASFATDGEDGPTDAAGAIVTGETASLGRDHGLNARQFLDRNDSHTFFKQLDEKSRVAGERESGGDNYLRHLIQTGSTGTNVNDLLLIMTYPE